MATKKDLVEAYSFSRRRLVTAFVSGAPGGREVEPTKPGRMLVGGVALAILLIAGAAVAGALTGRPDPDLEKPGLVTDDHGALYVILGEDQVPGDDPRLRPVINVTSAQLILGAGQETRKVKDEILSEAKKGPSIGILDAPATVPDPESLVNSGWISCTATDYGIKTEVSDQPQVERTPRIGFVVRAAGTKKRYLIAEAPHPDHPTRAYSYELPEGNIDPLLDGVGASPGAAVEGAARAVLYAALFKLFGAHILAIRLFTVLYAAAISAGDVDAGSVGWAVASVEASSDRRSGAQLRPYRGRTRLRPGS